MKLDVDRVQGSRLSSSYVQLACNQIGQLMEVLGIRSMRAATVDGGSTRVAVADSIKAFDFAPPEIAALAVCAASDLARVMAAVGVSRLSISDVPDADRDSLASAWGSAVERGPSPNLVPPPDAVPDMEPVEVDL